jgi:hypothetical protein
MGVGANTEAAAAAAGIDKVTQSTQGLSNAIGGISRNAQAATSQMQQMEAEGRRLAGVQQILSRELGRRVDEASAAMFLDRFARMQRNHTFGASRVRAYDSFEDWYSGHRSSFASSASAERHRRHVFSIGMQGTPWAQDNPPAESPGESRVRSGMGFARTTAGVLSGDAGSIAGAIEGVAGIEAISSMGGPIGWAIGAAVSTAALAAVAAVKGTQWARQEADALDPVKRQLGDVGVSFLKLREAVDKATEGLGLSDVEAAQLAGTFVKASGGRGGIEQTAEGISVGTGLARAFGLDPATGVGFMGSMARLGGDSFNQRKFVLEIAEAIAKSGYSADSDKLLAAVTSLADASAKLSGITPEAGKYADAIAALSSEGRPGLDPEQAGSLLGQADAAIRQGGFFGNASKNFTYAALTRGAGNEELRSTPWAVQALQEGGLFATPDSVFHSGLWAGVYGRLGNSKKTNFDAVMGLFYDQYKDEGERAAAEANYFHLGIGQARELDQMAFYNPGLGNKANDLLKRAGVDESTMNPSGILGIAKIATAKGNDELRAILQSREATGDMSREDDKRLNDILGMGNFGKSQEELARYFAEHGQENTVTTQMRQDEADLQKAMTALGDRLLTPLNGMENLLAAIAQKSGIDPIQAALEGQFGRKSDNNSGVSDGVSSGKGDAGGGQEGPGTSSDGNEIEDQGFLPPWPKVHGVAGETSSTTGTGSAKPGLNVAGMPSGVVAPSASDFAITDAQQKVIDYYAHGDSDKRVKLMAILATENAGYKRVNNHALNIDSEAYGAYQIVPDTWEKLTGGLNQALRSNFALSTGAASALIDQLEAQFHTKDNAVIAAGYNGGPRAAVAAAAGHPTSDTRKYITNFSANANYYAGYTPLPASPADTPAPIGSKVNVTGEVTVHVADVAGNVRHSVQVPLQQYSPGLPAGGGRVTQ